MPDADYSKADRDCDVVMKGGVTSGIVYPAAVCRLAKDYRFRSIGGTSAGAIAAVASAAAEFGRRAGNPGSFAELEKLPETLGRKDGAGKSLLLRLFRPDASTDSAFQVLLACLKSPLQGFLAAAQHYILFGVLVASPFLVFLAPFVGISNLLAGRIIVGLISALPCFLLAVVAFVVGVLLAFAFDLKKKVPANFFGLCSGMGADDALTPWLHALFQKLAGRPLDQPLTFGDLRGTDPQRSIDLLVMTTNVTHGRPYTLPMSSREEKRFYFKVEEFRKLFPREVVDWMVAKAPSRDERFKADGLLPLPASDDLPVVVGARMSLSFPLLISAVPLHAIDFERGRQPGQKPEVCWFSDGGISSNFPVHFFDSPLPSRPTFAVNLRYLEADPAAGEEVVMARNNLGGLAEWFKRFPSSLTGFLGAVFESMQNWQDNTQIRLPGWRDRVVHVVLGPGQGGVNLDMDEKVIAALSERGGRAGGMLADRFTGRDGSKLDWENHRWVRFRSTMAMLEESFGKLATRLDPADVPPTPGDLNYAATVAQPDAELPSFPWGSEERRARAIAAAKELQALCAGWAAADDRLGTRAPFPLPELRPRPRL